MNNKIIASDDFQISDEVLHTFSDSTKMELSDSLIAIHRKANRSKYFLLDSFVNRAIAAAVATLMIVAGAVLFNNFILSNSNNQLVSHNNNEEISSTTSRGNNDKISNIEIQNGIKHYQNKQYNLALNSFSLIPESNIAILYSGFCNMELGKYIIAENQFKSIIIDDDNLLIDQAEWNLGMCYLKSNKLDLALEIFTKISKPDGYYRNKATQILDNY